MSFRPKYIPPAIQTPEEFAEEAKFLQGLKEASKREEAKMKAAREACYVRQKAEAEAERLERERIANLPTPETTEYPISGLHFVNGQVVNKPTPAPSVAVTRIQQLTESFAAARNVPSRGIQKV